jgi:hypothetical protein
VRAGADPVEPEGGGDLQPGPRLAGFGLAELQRGPLVLAGRAGGPGQLLDEYRREYESRYLRRTLAIPKSSGGWAGSPRTGEVPDLVIDHVGRGFDLNTGVWTWSEAPGCQVR